MAYTDYEAVIGLEVHAQLLTQSKMFCSCSTQFGGEDNANTCPVCTGMPGALPTINERALEFSIKTGIALNCNIRNDSVFARKNYFYPDLPKGYQISQFDKPLCEHGYIEFYLKDEKKRISITRAHMEEDAGKSSHSGDYSLINLNRSSVPLLEIVSGPDLRSPEEAAEYARSMRSILLYLQVCDGNLEEGSMRCDCNVSVRKKGVEKFGTKVELKNINSFRFVEKAIQYEIERQIDALDSGEKIIQETRLYDPDKNRTFSMRAKEEAHDYRYFPDPDLLPVHFDGSKLAAIKAALPELPLVRAERFQTEYGLPKYDALVLTQTRALAEYFEVVAKQSGNSKSASNWVMVELLAKLNEAKKDVSVSPIPSENLAKLIQLIDKGTISGKIAKDVFAQMFAEGKDPEAIISASGVSQISDEGELGKIVDAVIAANPKQTEEFRSGKDKLFGFFVGQAMKASKGQAHPELLNKILNAKLRK
jgi:aspartyl-tRNA(Asn)/glutamyl-tRNA(Gln) amidotransferase subunit B